MEIPSLKTLQHFIQTTRLVYAYQVLLLLVMISRADERGEFSLDTTAKCFARFYQARKDAGRPREKAQGAKQPAMDPKRLCNTIKVSPFPRFERHSFLTLQPGPGGEHFVIAAPLQKALTPNAKVELRDLAIQRLTKHFQEEKEMREGFVRKMRAEGEQCERYPSQAREMG